MGFNIDRDSENYVKDMLNAKKCQIREDLNNFFDEYFTGMTQKDIDYEILNMFENCVKSQENVIINLYQKNYKK
jgi:hypothetical protein